MVRKFVLSLACLAVLAPAALAATPKVGRFSGKTSQAKKVALRTVDTTKVRYFVMNWQASCSKTQTYTARVKLSNVKLGPKGGFTGHLFYKDTLKKGQHTRVYVKLAGRFVSSKKATGTWRGAVRLFKGDKQTAYCHSGTVSWKATLEPAS
jgi:hypothetical protein